MSEDLQGNEDLVQELLKVETTLVELKERYAQIQGDRERKEELLRKREELKAQPKEDHIKTQLNHIKTELEQIELNLESRLISWSSFKEPFWQAVRYLGLGIVIGWTLKSFLC